MVTDYEYKVGGSLEEDAPSYVRRKADYDLYDRLKAGKLCYVFNSRQMGKTSLLVRTMKQLQADDFACAVIDISGLGSQDLTPEQWYGSIIDCLVTELNFIEPEDLAVWWDKSIEISPVRRLGKLFDELLLPNITQNIVIFLDEIDSILRLDFPADDFFALIRSCYQRRSFKAEYKRLTFAFFGVATPSDLIKDEDITPFNIGEAIQLYGFQLDEIAPLAKGLEGKVENPQVLMGEVLAWTGGQPLLTQKVCNFLIRDLKSLNSPTITGEQLVEEVVRNGIIDNWEVEDEQEHFKTIRDRMLTNDKTIVGLLGLYQRILQEGEIAVDASSEQMRLRLTGLVVEQQGKLIVYNQIYKNIFNLDWVNKELYKLRPYADKLNAWVKSKYQNKSCLLHGKSLLDALIWSEHRSLSILDYHFLTAGQNLEMQNIRKRLEFEESVKLFLEEKNQKLNRKIRIGFVVLLSTLITAIVPALFAHHTLKQADEAKIKLNDMTSALNKTREKNQELSKQNYHILNQLEADNRNNKINDEIQKERARKFNEELQTYREAENKKRQQRQEVNSLSAQILDTHNRIKQKNKIEEEINKNIFNMKLREDLSKRELKHHESYEQLSCHYLDKYLERVPYSLEVSDSERIRCGISVR